MAYEILNYEARIRSSRPARRDAVVLGVAAGYTAANVTLMVAYASSILGPVPFSLIFLFLGVSGIGVISSLPVWLLLRHAGVTWRSGIGLVVIFGFLAWFNYWILWEASATV